MSYYIEFDVDGNQINYMKKEDGIVFNDKVSYEAPDGFNPIEDLCKLENDNVVLLKDMFKNIIKENKIKNLKRKNIEFAKTFINSKEYNLIPIKKDKEIYYAPVDSKSLNLFSRKKQWLKDNSSSVDFWVYLDSIQNKTIKLNLNEMKSIDNKINLFGDEIFKNTLTYINNIDHTYNFDVIKKDLDNIKINILSKIDFNF